MKIPLSLYIYPFFFYAKINIYRHIIIYIVQFYLLNKVKVKTDRLNNYLPQKEAQVLCTLGKHLINMTGIHHYIGMVQVEIIICLTVNGTQISLQKIKHFERSEVLNIKSKIWLAFQRKNMELKRSRILSAWSLSQQKTLVHVHICDIMHSWTSVSWTWPISRIPWTCCSDSLSILPSNSKISQSFFSVQSS